MSTSTATPTKVHRSRMEEPVSKEPVVYPRYTDTIAKKETPLLDLSALLSNEARKRNVRLLAKAEFMNPGFSMKDRIATHILDHALKNGSLKVGGTVVAASSGNTGASIAMMCAKKGLKAVIITKPSCSQEKMDTIRAYGATLYVEKDYMSAETRLSKENPDWYAVNQYDNPLNADAHEATTGPEIWKQTDGTITDFVMTASTGGTITGSGRYLKKQNPNVKVTLADPYKSVFYHYHRTGEVVKPETRTKVEGAGKATIPGVIDFKVIDDVVQVEDDQAFAMCHHLARTEGLMVGGSAGLNVHAAVRVAEAAKDGSVVVTILCDLGVKYLSTVFRGIVKPDEETKEK